MKTVRSIVQKWKKECKLTFHNLHKDPPQFPDGIYFFESTSPMDVKAFKKLMKKCNIPESEYYIERKTPTSDQRMTVNFRV